jgi:hypothetical protein
LPPKTILDFRTSDDESSLVQLHQFGSIVEIAVSQVNGLETSGAIPEPQRRYCLFAHLPSGICTPPSELTAAALSDSAMIQELHVRVQVFFVSWCLCG